MGDNSKEKGMDLHIDEEKKRFPPGINNIKGAFVVSRDLEYGLSRMFQMSSEAKTPIQVFRIMAKAEK
jgi:hypothetical protein